MTDFNNVSPSHVQFVSSVSQTSLFQADNDNEARKGKL